MPVVHGWRDPGARLRGVSLLGINAIVGRWAGSALPAQRLCAEIEALADLTGSPPARAVAAALRTALHGARGELAQARAQLARAEACLAELGRDHRAASLVTLVADLTLAHVEPDWAGVGERMEAFAARRDPARGRASYGRRSARPRSPAPASTTARGRCWRRSRRCSSASSPWVEAQPGAVAFAAEATWVLRAPEFARPLLDPARAVVAAHAGDFYMANSELALARLLTVLGARLAGGVRSRPSHARGTRPARARRDRRARRRPGAPPRRRRRGRAVLAAAAERFDARHDRLARTPSRGPRPPPRRAHAARGRGAAARRRRAHQQGDRRRARRQRAHDRAPPGERVPQDLRRNRADATAYVLRSRL